MVLACISMLRNSVLIEWLKKVFVGSFLNRLLKPSITYIAEELLTEILNLIIY